MKDITISIVAYNDEEDVRAAVESIERCTLKTMSKTLYIIDNSSVPNNLVDLESQYPDVVYKTAGRNLGFGKGHNFVINELDSKFHAIVNPDTQINEDSFKILTEFLVEQDCGMVAPRITDAKGNLLRVYRRKLTVFDMFIRMFIKDGFEKRKDYHTMQDMDYSKPFHVPFAQGSFLVIRTDLYKELQGFDERFFLYMEDADLCRRVNEVSNLLYCPYTSVVHKWEQGSHKSPQLFKTHVKAMIKYFRKWGLR